MPKRVSPEITPSQLAYEAWGADHVGPFESLMNYNVRFREYAGSVTPNYRAKTRKILPENPYNLTLVHVQVGRDNYRTYEVHPGYPERYLNGQDGWNANLGDMNPFVFRPTFMVEDTKNKAVQRLQKQLSGVRVNVAQFFAERHQLARMLESTATRIVQAARALKRANLRDFTRALSLDSSRRGTTAQLFKKVQRTPASMRIANHWLEYVYGWRPLLSDITGAAELLAEHVEFPKQPQGKLRASARSNEKEGHYDVRGDNMTKDRWSSHSVDVRLKASYMLDDSAKRILSQTGITNPALLAWELLPYSFVVDWFVPVANYLESLTAYDGFTLHSMNTTTFCKSDLMNSFGVSQITPGLPTRSEREAADFYVTKITYDRANTLPAYSMNVHSPIGGAPVERLATAMSLLRQLFRKR